MRRIICLTAAALLLTIGLAGPTAAQMNPASPEAFSDRDIKLAVKRAFRNDPGVADGRVDVLVADGIVTLSGTVDHVLTRRRADRVARAVKGVRSVVDNIEVMPTDRSDDAVERDVRQALADHPVTSAWDVDASVENGVVTLTGRLESHQRKWMLNRLAAGVRGVVEINNQAEVVAERTRSDEAIRKDVVAALRWDALVDDEQIEVTVDNGQVFLTGNVGSAAEKNRAIDDAWVAGVDLIDAEQLVVTHWGREEIFRETKYVVKPDREIKTAVRDALIVDPRVDAHRIEVELENGTVILTGRTPSLEAKRAAAHTAANTVGVRRVENHVDVRVEPEPSDGRIAVRVQRALDRDPYIERYEVEVDVENGRVYLDGRVNSRFEKAWAERVVSRASGVTDVKNGIEVADPTEPLTYNPHVDTGFNVYGYNWHRRPDPLSAPKPDAELQKDVERELRWSPFVNSDEVDVTVEDGVVRLAGTVGTWRERRAARENAIEGGALVVNNDLEVKSWPEER